MASFTVRIHPIDATPHYVHIFLDQVERFAIIIISPEVVQAVALPRSNGGKTYNEKMMGFEDMDGVGQNSFPGK